MRGAGVDVENKNQEMHDLTESMPCARLFGVFQEKQVF